MVKKMASSDPRYVALAALSRREHSRLELTQKLKKAGFSNEDIEPLLEDLIKRDWLNEDRFIEIFVRSRFNQGHGPMRIRYDLQQRGISGEMIANALLTYQDDWAESARELRIRRFGETPPSSPQLRAKQMRFLASRGFLPDHIRYALKS
jgi:regulatory protein